MDLSKQDFSLLLQAISQVVPELPRQLRSKVRKWLLKVYLKLEQNETPQHLLDELFEILYEYQGIMMILPDKAGHYHGLSMSLNEVTLIPEFAPFTRLFGRGLLTEAFDVFYEHARKVAEDSAAIIPDWAFKEQQESKLNMRESYILVKEEDYDGPPTNQY